MTAVSRRSTFLLLLGLELTFQLMERSVARQDLRHTRVWLAPLADRREKLPVLQLDAVHRNVDLRYVDYLVPAVDEVVVARDIRAVVADVAEEGAQRPFVVERERQRA